MIDQKEPVSIQDYVTIKQLIAMNPAFNEGGLRSLIFNANKNGFNKCIRRMGRKILISISALDRTIQQAS